MCNPEERPETEIEIIWRQKSPNDWVALLRNIRTGEKREVRTTEAFAAAVQLFCQQGQNAACRATVTGEPPPP